MDKSYQHCDSKRIEDKNIDELIGICKGVLSDNEFNEDEKRFLLDTIKKNKLANHTLVKDLYSALTDQENSLDDLKNLLILFTGGSVPSYEIKSMSTNLPIEKDLISVEFKDKIFCLTGKFSSAIGNRKAIEDIIQEEGGKAKKTVTLDLDYLVIGEFGNDDWKHSTSGNKIEKAMNYRDINHSKIKIISEEQLLKYL
jgi:NAD-dependent DNA ligase